MDDLIIYLIGLLIGFTIGCILAYMHTRKELRRIIKDSERNAEEYIDALREVYELRTQIMKNKDNE